MMKKKVAKAPKTLGTKDTVKGEKTSSDSLLREIQSKFGEGAREDNYKNYQDNRRIICRTKPNV
jgi:hypothetical protein